MVMNKAVRGLFLAEVFYGIRPQDVAHQTLSRWFTEPVNLQPRLVNLDIEMCGWKPYAADILKGMQLW